jgi:hypothetical protein
VISILFGPDGSGKSLYQVQKIMVDQLRFTKRNLVTNAWLKVPEFNAMLEAEFPGESIDLCGRLRILTEDEAKEFWKYRGPFKWGGREGLDVIEDRGENGVCYVIDEAGQAGFSAAGWAQKDSMGSHDRVATRGGRCLWYLEQHRKLNDDVFASCNGRFPTGIAKPFRDKARDFVLLRNGYQRQMGIFKAQGKFTATHYNCEPGPNVEAWKKEGFKLDLKWAGCYETAKGVGVTGTTADKGRRAKGIPILWVFPIMIALGSLMFFVPWALGHVLSKNMTGISSQTHKAVEKGIGAVQDLRSGMEPSTGEKLSPSQANPNPVKLVVVVGVSGSGRDERALIDGDWIPVVAHANFGVLVLADGRLGKLRPAHVESVEIPGGERSIPLAPVK